MRESDGTIRYVVDKNAASKLGSYVNPPLETYPDATGGTAVASAPAAKQKQDTKGATYATASAESKPAPAPTKTAYAPTASDDSIFSRMKSSVGRFFTGDDDKSAPSAPVAAAKPAPKPAPRPQTAAKQTQPAQQPAPQAAPPAQEPVAAQPAPSPTPARQSAASGASLMSGATPTVPAGSFDARWGAVR